MPLPALSPDRVEWVVRQVVAYIAQQRQTYRPSAAPLGPNQKTAMRPFFSEHTLDLTRTTVLAGHRIANPPFYGELLKMGFDAGSLPNFSLMAAIAFVDTVVSHEQFTNRVLFHELGHVVQYETLGLEEFASKYVRDFLSGGSYEAIPLERNAYELDARFAAAHSQRFSVSTEVQAWRAAGRF